MTGARAATRAGATPETGSGAVWPWAPAATRPPDPAPDPGGSRVEVVDPADLTRVGARPPLGRYTAALWGRRSFLWHEARARVTSGVRETLLGQAWLIVRPVLDGLAYFVVFGLLLDVRRGVPNFIGYLVVGTFLFAFTSQSVTSAGRSIHASRNVIRAFAFPRASVPFSVVLQGVLGLAPSMVAMLGLLLVLPERASWTWHALLFPVVLTLQVVFVTGTCLVVARLGAMLPDVNQLIAVLLRFWFYGSGVFFSFEQLDLPPTLLTVVHANPMFLVLDAARDCLLYGRAPAGGTWLLLGAWSVGVLLVGYVFFWRGEETYGRG